MEAPKRTVYVLKNADNPPRYYTGVTADLKARLGDHNAGRCPHTSKHRPWAVDAIVKFADEGRALRFERSLCEKRPSPAYAQSTATSRQCLRAKRGSTNLRSTRWTELRMEERGVTEVEVRSMLSTIKGIVEAGT